MIPSPPKPRYPAGTRVRVVQHVRVGSHRWSSEIVGVIEDESRRPVGGIEMGTKHFYCYQPTLYLRLDDGEHTTVALDDKSEVYVLS